MCIHPCKSLWIKASAKCKCSLPRRLALQCALALRGTALCARPPLSLYVSLSRSPSPALLSPPPPLFFSLSLYPCIFRSLPPLYLSLSLSLYLFESLLTHPRADTHTCVILVHTDT